MSASNSVNIKGRLVEVPELKKTQSNVSAISTRIAVRRNFKNANGDYDSDFFTIVAFNGKAEFIAKYFTKGDMIAVNGELRSNTYQKRDGSKGYVVEIAVSDVDFCAPKSNSTQQSSVNEPAIDSHSELPIDDDSLPL